jgi:hypothetical protein
LDELPELVAQTGDGPVLLVLGQVVRRSRPWRERLGVVISALSGKPAKPLEDRQLEDIR